MASPSPEQSSPSVPRTPTCTRCDQPMRLVGVEPNTRYTNLDEWSYVCEQCGEGIRNPVAHRINGGP